MDNASHVAKALKCELLFLVISIFIPAKFPAPTFHRVSLHKETSLWAARDPLVLACSVLCIRELHTRVLQEVGLPGDGVSIRACNPSAASKLNSLSLSEGTEMS